MRFVCKNISNVLQSNTLKISPPISPHNKELLAIVSNVCIFFIGVLFENKICHASHKISWNNVVGKVEKIAQYKYEIFTTLYK